LHLRGLVVERFASQPEWTMVKRWSSTNCIARAVSVCACLAGCGRQTFRGQIL